MRRPRRSAIPVIARLIDKISIDPNPTPYPDRFPHHHGATVTIALNDGRRFSTTSTFRAARGRAESNGRMWTPNTERWCRCQGWLRTQDRGQPRRSRTGFEPASRYMSELTRLLELNRPSAPSPGSGRLRGGVDGCTTTEEGDGQESENRPSRSIRRGDAVVGTFTSAGVTKQVTKCVVLRLTAADGTVGITSIEPSAAAKSPGHRRGSCRDAPRSDRTRDRRTGST